MNAANVVQDILTTVSVMLPRLIELFSQAGGRDAFITAIDGTLAAARARTDAELDAKWRRSEHDTLPELKAAKRGEEP